MTKPDRILPWLLRSLAVPAVLCALAVSAQTPPAPVHPTAAERRAAQVQAPIGAAPVSDRDLEATQKELIRLLKLSPTLTTVVAHDPTLLRTRIMSAATIRSWRIFLPHIPKWRAIRSSICLPMCIPMTGAPTRLSNAKYGRAGAAKRFLVGQRRDRSHRRHAGFRLLPRCAGLAGPPVP